MSKARLTNVDGLRGFAAMAVVLQHYVELVLPRVADPAVAQGMNAMTLGGFSPGRFGVVTFFCISGFVVPFSFKGPRPLANFAVSRFFRLYPAYWLSMLLALLIVPHVTDTIYTARQIAANATMVQRLFGEKDMLGVYWTLLIEITFYSICFAAFAAGRNGSRLHDPRFSLGMIALMALIGLVGGMYRFRHPASDLPVGLPTYLAAMFFGIIVRLHWLERSPSAARYFWPALIVLCVGAVGTNTLAYLHAHNEKVSWVASNSSYLVGVAAFLLCLRYRLFASAFWAFFGLISYSAYLIHPVALETVRGLWPAGGDWRVAVIGIAFAVFSVTILGAVLMQRLVEAPSVRASHRLGRMLAGASKSD